MDFIKKHNYFSPGYYTPEYFSTAEEFIKYRNDLILEMTGKPLNRVMWGFDCDQNDWFHETPVLLFIDDNVYSINNWKMDETALDKNIIRGTEFIDWMGYYNPITKQIRDKKYENDLYNVHAIWKEYDIKHGQDRIIKNITPLVYDCSSETGYSLYDSNNRYGNNQVLDYFDEVYPEIKSATYDRANLCQSMMGLAIQFTSWALHVYNALDENCIEPVI